MGKLRDSFHWQFLHECDYYFPGVLCLFQVLIFFWEILFSFLLCVRVSAHTRALSHLPQCNLSNLVNSTLCGHWFLCSAISIPVLYFFRLSRDHSCLHSLTMNQVLVRCCGQTPWAHPLQIYVWFGNTFKVQTTLRTALGFTLCQPSWVSSICGECGMFIKPLSGGISFPEFPFKFPSIPPFCLSS